MFQKDTKDIIIEKTFGLLLRKGYDGVSISDIQRETGMARGLLYHYFGNKEKLFVESTAKYFIDMFDVEYAVIKNFTVEGMIEYTVKRYDSIMSFSLCGTSSDSVSIMNYDFLFYRVMQQSDYFLDKYNKVRNNELNAWITVLDNSRRAKTIRDDIDIKKTARYFVFLTDGVWMNSIDHKSYKHLVGNLEITLTDYYNLIKK